VTLPFFIIKSIVKYRVHENPLFIKLKNSYFRAKKNPAFGGVFCTLVNFYKRQSASRLMGVPKKKKLAADFM
jgi:hypothetical protein